MVLFSTTGRSDDKLRIVFDMCDSDEDGVIQKGELTEMLASLVEMAKTNHVRQEDVEALIESMFKEAGFQNKEVCLRPYPTYSIEYNDFQFCIWGQKPIDATGCVSKEASPMLKLHLRM